ncbi:MAG: hypothetical protein AAGI24_09460 [Pseudomonadota bacterium]
MKAIRIAGFSLLVSTGVPLAEAEEGINPIFTSRFNLQLGVQYTDSSATVAVTRRGLPETEIDLDDMGIDDSSTVFYAGARWRIADRWTASFTYNEFDENGSTVIEESFNFDGEEYPVGAELDSRLQLNAYILDLAYSFGKGSNYEWGAGLGLHSFEFAAELEAALFVGDTEEAISDSSESLLAPVPNFRFFADYAFNRRNAIRFNAGWLSANYEDYDGALLYASLRFDHNFGNNFGVGLGVQYTDIELDHEPSDTSSERYDADILGAMAYVSYRF